MRTAEKIYSESTSERAATANLAELLARRIEDDIASSDLRSGGVMGSLRQLSERYSVGRAAAREAVALLERRRLGRLRPGPCGGFVVAQPGVDIIAAELADYFRMAGITPLQLADAREAVDLMAAWLAARAHGDYAAVDTLLAPAHAVGVLDWHLRVRTALAELSGDPAVLLFVVCLNALTVDLACVSQVPADDWRADAEASAAAIRAALRNGDQDALKIQAEKLDLGLRGWLRDDDGPLSLPELPTARQTDDRTLARLVARRLAAEILRGGSAGQRLGSEWDLCERFSVSRATLRQAIRLLQDGGFVECRRGRGNGLVVRDLHGTGTIRLVLAFLIGQQMDPTSAGTVMFQLNRFVPALAVNRADSEGRQALAGLLERVQLSDPIDRYDLLRFVQCVSRLSDSPVIDLFSRCLAAYEARFHPSLRERLPARIQNEYFDLIARLLAKMTDNTGHDLAWGKQQSACVMLAMSRERPI